MKFLHKTKMTNGFCVLVCATYPVSKSIFGDGEHMSLLPVGCQCIMMKL